MDPGLRREDREVLIATSFDFFTSSFAGTTTSGGDPLGLSLHFWLAPKPRRPTVRAAALRLLPRRCALKRQSPWHHRGLRHLQGVGAVRRAGAARLPRLSRPPCRAPHPLYRRHLPHPLNRGNPRDFRRGPERYLERGRIAQAATADRQGVCLRRHWQGIRPHGSQQASRQDRRDALTCYRVPDAARHAMTRRRSGTHLR